MNGIKNLEPPRAMNTNLHRRPSTVLAFTLSAASGLAMLLSALAGAGEPALKGAERLTALSSPQVVRSSAARSPGLKASDCGDCRTVVVARARTSAKGGEVLSASGVPTTPVAVHGCGGCATTLGASGHGKGKVQVPLHACSSAAAASACCK